MSGDQPQKGRNTADEPIYVEEITTTTTTTAYVDDDDDDDGDSVLSQSKIIAQQTQPLAPNNKNADLSKNPSSISSLLSNLSPDDEMLLNQVWIVV